jgi:hypothetical protein
MVGLDALAISSAAVAIQLVGVVANFAATQLAAPQTMFVTQGPPVGGQSKSGSTVQIPA